GVTMDTEALFAVQTNAPSNAMACGESPRFDATVKTVPGNVGVRRYMRPGLVAPVTKTNPDTVRAAEAAVAAGQVSRSTKSRAWIRRTEFAAAPTGTQTSSPSETGCPGTPNVKAP